MDIPAAHNDAQGLSVMRSAPKLRPRTPMSGLVLPSCAQRRPWPAQAGTGTCVHIPIQLIPIASLAWLGKQQPCPLLFFNFLLGSLRNRGGHTHTHTHLQCKQMFYTKQTPGDGGSGTLDYLVDALQRLAKPQALVIPAGGRQVARSGGVWGSGK